MMTDKYSDKITQASKELQERSGFVCEVCQKTYSRGGAVKKDLTCCNRTMNELVRERLDA